AAAYNAGPGRVQRWISKRSKLPAETRHYVATITGRAADTWRGVKAEAVGFAVPRGVPCHAVETFAEATPTEQAVAARPPGVAPGAVAMTPHNRKTSTASARVALSRRTAHARRATRTHVAAANVRERGRRKG